MDKEELEIALDTAISLLDASYSDLLSLHKRVVKLEEVLKQYADSDNWIYYAGETRLAGPYLAQMDKNSDALAFGGELARKALTEKESSI